jgi:hypothetical protein
VTTNQPGAWRVEIRENGRSGSVDYHEGADTIPCYWEFCGGDSMASISIGDTSDWDNCHPWAAGRRQQILERIAAEVVRQKAPTCRALIDEQSGWITIRSCLSK